MEVVDLYRAQAQQEQEAEKVEQEVLKKNQFRKCYNKALLQSCLQVSIQDFIMENWLYSLKKGSEKELLGGVKSLKKLFWPFVGERTSISVFFAPNSICSVPE